MAACALSWASIYIVQRQQLRMIGQYFIYAATVHLCAWKEFYWTESELRCLDTVFKKLSYSLLNTLNFRTVKFK